MDAFYRILLILIGLGMVIFVHELGHFLVARWCGVLVERFSIGFGPVIFSRKSGDTEYAISAIPFGGYVKMLGQTDTPEVEEPIDDERSYQNKTVPQRMAIISAGVIMNIIFGFVCFAFVFKMGKEELIASIGCALPGKPAWKAGLRAGDQIVEINGRKHVNYETLLMDVALSNPRTESVKLRVVRDGETLPPVEIVPVSGEARPQIGVLPGPGLELLRIEDPYHGSTPAAAAGFKGGDEVVAVNGNEVSTHQEFVEIMDARKSDSVTVTVKRKSEVESEAETVDEVDLELQPNYVRTLGPVQMQIGGIVALQPDAAASEAVDEQGNPAPLLPKDIIKAVDGVEDIDPMRLPDVITEKAGSEVKLTILRQGTNQKTMVVTVVPRPIPTWIDFPDVSPLVMFGSDESWPVSIPSLGIAYTVEARVRKAEQREGEPAPKLQPGDRIVAAEISRELDGRTYDNAVDVKEDAWPALFWAMQFPDYKITLKVEREGGDEPVMVAIDPQPDKTWPMRLRGLLFADDYRITREDTILGAVAAGLERTRTSVLRLYLMIRGLITQDISARHNFVGPIRIIQFGYQLADNISVFLMYLGMLNINLAVVNFLPIPILDGGHMVFLAYELLMRRRPSERIVAVANLLGMAFIVCLMLFVIGLDLQHFFFS